MTTLSEPVAVQMTPVEFATFARRMKWDDRTVELLVKPPVLSKPFYVGDAGKTGGRMVTIVENRPLSFRK